jgi:hypothetical protein
MKANDRKQASSITDPLLKDLLERQKAYSQAVLIKKPEVGSEPLSSPDLYQDAGGSYNSDFTFPQE